MKPVSRKKTASVPTVYDVVVVGGGAGGMMAAVAAATNGANTLLIEKNKQLGVKLSITGGGRCNVTNNKPVVRDMVMEYKDDGKFLFSTFTQFGVKEMVVWLAERGVKLKEENEGRLFPHTEKAQTICNVLEHELHKQNVTVLRETTVESIQYIEKKKQFKIKTSDGQVEAKKCILATGGTARPETGSTGDGFQWLKQLGHTVVPNSNTLVPVALKSRWTKTLSGVTLSDVKVSAWSDSKKMVTKRGRILFTHVGLSGPLILNMSKLIGDTLAHAAVILKIDLFPHLNEIELKNHIQTLLTSNKKIQNALATDMPLQLVKGVLHELAIDGETPCHSVIKVDRTKLLTYLKAVPLPVKGLLGVDKAVASAGGVILSEVDFKTMESKIVPSLYIVGDLLNVNRPSGGYSLQLCWSTGYVAGHSAG